MARATCTPARASVACSTWLITTEGSSPAFTISFQSAISAAESPLSASMAFALSWLNAYCVE